MVRRFDPTLRYDRRARVAILIVTGISAVARGSVYVIPGRSLNTDYVAVLDPVIPMEVWGGIWIGTGVALWVGAYCPRVARWAMSTLGSLCGLWCVSFLMAWLVLDQSTAYVTSAAFLMGSAFCVVFTYLMEPVQWHSRGSEQ